MTLVAPAHGLCLGEDTQGFWRITCLSELNNKVQESVMGGIKVTKSFGYQADELEVLSGS